MARTIGQLPIGFPAGDWFVPAEDGAGTATTKVMLASINALARTDSAWYPAFGGSVSNPTVSLGRAARWIRQGAQVWLFGHMAVTSTTGGSGNLFITGLPFRVAPREYGATSRPGAHPGSLGVVKGWANTPPTEIIAWPNTFQLNLASAQTAANAWAFTPVSNLAAGCEINFTVTYLTNEP